MIEVIVFVYMQYQKVGMSSKLRGIIVIQAKNYGSQILSYNITEQIKSWLKGKEKKYGFILKSYEHKDVIYEGTTALGYKDVIEIDPARLLVIVASNEKPRIGGYDIYEYEFSCQDLYIAGLRSLNNKKLYETREYWIKASQLASNEKVKGYINEHVQIIQDYINRY